MSPFLLIFLILLAVASACGALICLGLYRAVKKHSPTSSPVCVNSVAVPEKPLLSMILEDLEKTSDAKSESVSKAVPNLPYFTMVDGSDFPIPVPFTSSTGFRVAGVVVAGVVGFVVYLFLVL